MSIINLNESSNQISYLQRLHFKIINSLAINTLYGICY